MPLRAIARPFAELAIGDTFWFNLRGTRYTARKDSEEFAALLATGELVRPYRFNGTCWVRPSA